MKDMKEDSIKQSLQGFIAFYLAVGFGLVLNGVFAVNEMRGGVEQDLYLSSASVCLVLEHVVVLTIYADFAYLLK